MVEIVKQNFEDNKKIYEKIEKRLRNKINSDVPIDQVGSTAVPNMYGKNIMDILIGANDKQQFDELVKIINDEGFVPSKKSKDEIYQFFSSTSDETKSGDIHIHLAIRNTSRYNEFIILRDYLLENPDEASKYSDFKRYLIENGIVDRREYKRFKSEYVASLIEKAKKNRGD